MTIHSATASDASASQSERHHYMRLCCFVVIVVAAIVATVAADAVAADAAVSPMSQRLSWPVPSTVTNDHTWHHQSAVSSRRGEAQQELPSRLIPSAGTRSARLSYLRR